MPDHYSCLLIVVCWSIKLIVEVHLDWKALYAFETCFTIIHTNELVLTRLSCWAANTRQLNQMSRVGLTCKCARVNVVTGHAEQCCIAQEHLQTHNFLFVRGSRIFWVVTRCDPSRGNKRRGRAKILPRLPLPVLGLTIVVTL